MDILVISNIINKFSKIIFDNDKSKYDILYLNEFLEDPFNLNIDFLNTFYMQYSSDIKNIDFNPGHIEMSGKRIMSGGKAAGLADKISRGLADKIPGGLADKIPGGLADKISGGMPSLPTGTEASKQVQELSGADADQMKELAEKMGGPGGEALRNMAEAGTDEKELKLVKLLRLMIKSVIYPLIFIFLAIFPYIYVTYASFKKLIKSYRKNVRTV